MKARRTDEKNFPLTLPGDPDGTHTLYVERCRFFDPSMGETEDNSHPGYESLWQPNDLERLQLANGGDVLVRIWGSGHPPISVGVTYEPGEALYLKRAHVDRALEVLHRALVDRMAAEPEVAQARANMVLPTLEELQNLFAEAVTAAGAQEIADALEEIAAEQDETESNGEVTAELDDAKCPAADSVYGRCTLDPGHDGPHMGIDGTFNT